MEIIVEINVYAHYGIIYIRKIDSQKSASPQPGIEQRVSGLPVQRANHYTTAASRIFDVKLSIISLWRYAFIT